MNERRDSLIMIAAALGLGAIYWYGVDRPQQRKLALLRDEIALLREDVALRDAKRGDMGELEKRLAAAESALGTFRTRIPGSAELGSFVAEVSKMADGRGLRERNLVPLEPQPHGGLMALPIRMGFLASFEATFAFLRDVSESPRVTRVSELKLERPDPFRGEVKAELTLQVFYEAA
jgi:Tfp pilus assembly protein PilO